MAAGLVGGEKGCDVGGGGGGQRGFPLTSPSTEHLFLASDVQRLWREPPRKCKMASAMKMNLLHPHGSEQTRRHLSAAEIFSHACPFLATAAATTRDFHHHSQLSAILISGEPVSTKWRLI